MDKEVTINTIIKEVIIINMVIKEGMVNKVMGNKVNKGNKGMGKIIMVIIHISNLMANKITDSRALANKIPMVIIHIDDYE
jgi:hypothetical protein